jgi:para-nitrobenzyl esterase
MGSPLARGLFNKAVVMSGGGRSNFTLAGRSRQSAEQSGVDFAKWAGLAGAGPAVLAQLRALPAAAVNQGGGMVPTASSAPAPAGPEIDGQIVVPVEAAYRAGTVARVPFIAGSNSNDLGFIDSTDPFDRFGSNAPRARELYEADGPGRTRMAKALVADELMTEPARLLVSLMRQRGQPAWYYRASYTPDSMRQAWALGLPHASEIPFFFRTIDAAGYAGPVTAADQAMSQQMSAYLVNFARTGNPNGGRLPTWPIYADQKREMMDFALSGPSGGPDPWREKLDLIEAAADHPGKIVMPRGSQEISRRNVQLPFTTATVLMGDILDDPAAKAIVARHLPALTNNDQVAAMRTLTLRNLQAFVPQLITDSALAAIDDEFSKLPAR